MEKPYSKDSYGLDEKWIYVFMGGGTWVLGRTRLKELAL